MPRKRLVRSDFLPYHITARTNNREPFSIPIAQAWKTVTAEIFAASLLFESEPLALVLMPNHFHLIMTVPNSDLGKIMNQVMRNISRTMNLISGRSGHVFGGPYFWSLIQSGIYYNHALKYVYRNPVKAGLCQQVEDYPWSTLSGLLGKSHLPFPLFWSRCGYGLAHPPESTESFLAWLNRPFPEEAEELIRLGLGGKNFGPVKDPQTRRPVEVLNALL